MISSTRDFKRRGFTLAEALVTLVIIGVIAALTIPGILVNTEQHEYKSALKKALSVLNQVIELNIALDSYGPLETVSMATPEDENSLFSMFKNRMNVISTSNKYGRGGTDNYAFFTADGMRFEFPKTPTVTGGTFVDGNFECARPGVKVQNELGVDKSTPCLIIVDVNGQRKPNPREDGKSYKVPKASGRSRILDVFPIIITDINAYPYGVVGQRAMFQHD
ncbi:MAG: type II secretion system protein [Candidatus Gastranaerophilales bacterium]|nr:type II secretion system protein [Candidatus Gastranaerophilales bacterium]